MAKFEWNETFISIEGEGPHSGKPTVYIRFSRCNFKCAGFNNPNNQLDEKGYAILPFNPKDVNSLSDFSPMEIGCDTQYAVNPQFAHIWKKGDENELAAEVMELLPHKTWIHPKTNQPVLLSLTGGEPTLKWKMIPTLLAHPAFDTLETILFETNCAVPFKKQFIDELNEWCGYQIGCNGWRDPAVDPKQIIWSNSPKLSASGENWDEAIRPEIALMQRDVIGSEQYFKFVCGPRERDFDEVAKAMEVYHAAGIPKDVAVLIMPESCTEEQQNNIAADVADMCIEKGYTYCHRVHNSVYANAIGK